MSAREENTNLFVFDEQRTEKETNIMAKVGIVMGSDSDMPVMAKAADILEKIRNRLRDDDHLSTP